MAEHPITIAGGAGEFEAAAIVAVVQYVLEAEEAARARPPGPNTPPAWVRTGLKMPFGRYTPPVIPEWGANAP